MSHESGNGEEELSSNWKAELKDAVDEVLAGYPVGTQSQIDIFVKKVRDNPLHDYKVVLKNPQRP